MKNRKLSSKAIISLVLSAVLFTMPAVAFSMNGDYALAAFAEETKPEENTEQIPSESETEGSTEESTENSTEGSTEENTGDGTVSGNDKPEPICNCEDKCGAYEYDKNCPVCVTDYKLCTYKTPNVSIKIKQPGEWHNDAAVVSFSVKDTADTGNFEIAKIQAKIGQNGSWTDVTEEKKIRISENCTIYVLVTDQKGNTYEKNRAIKCFDTVKPTLNAAISDGLLSIQVHDTDSGAKAVYVNGYEFTDLTEGTLNIRLQQFDAGYEYFTISAMDNAGNMSEIYKTKNPYYKDPADTSDGNPAQQLLESAKPTKPGSATGIVTEHTKTDSSGNTTSQTSPAEQKKQAMKEASEAENGKKENTEKSGQGKEFYTIQTATEKVFYLIIDRDGEEEMVYFLTEVTENDLLNATSDNSETLPKNSAALESAIPNGESALPNNNEEQIKTEGKETEVEETESAESTENTEEPEPEVKEEPNPMISYVLIGGFTLIVIGAAYYFKVIRKKKEDFIEDEDEDEEDNDEYENEDEESKEDTEEDFFDEENVK
ncbi:CD1107 family mobile element protein [Blautia sp.]|uniref:CD1107 family mobile element protein n=1 Tax=Blautia sp. TaxID=1955243 RepID=UPI003AB18376